MGPAGLCGFVVLLASVSAAGSSAAGAPSVAGAPSATQARRAAEEGRRGFEKTATTRPAAFAIETGRGRRIEASLMYVAAAPRMTATEWVIVAPLPPDTGSQRNVTVESTPKGTEAREPARPGAGATGAAEGSLARGVLVWRITPEDPSKKMVTLALTYRLELMPRLLVAREAPRSAGGAGSGSTAGSSAGAPAAGSNSTAASGAGAPAPSPGLSPGERLAYTSPGTLADFEAAPFQAWLTENGLRPAPNESDVEFSRRAFLFVKDKSSFEFKDKPDRRASVVCRTMRGDCGALTALYVAVLRANGIPARQLVGRWARTARPDEKLDGREWQREHIKTEFFAAGIGWVPVDVSVAVDIERKPGSVRHFGRDDGDFITLHVEPDLRVDTVHFGVKTLPLLQEPTFWVTGTGSMAGSTARYDWQVVRGRR